MTSFPTLNHHAKLMLSTKDWAGLPSSFDGWRPKRTLFCRQLLGIRKPDFICPSCSFNAVFDKQTLRCRRIWSSFRVRHKPHRKRAAVISNNVWEGDWTSQTDHHQAQEDSQLFRIGPLPGDLAEVEAFCRIFRVAEQLHTAIMENLCNPDTGECTVTYQPESPNSVCGDVSLLEERVVAGLACIATLLHRARQEVIAGRSASVSSFQVRDSNVVDDKLPPLALFRAEMKKCCENLQSALECYFPLTDEQSTDIWRRLQRLKNICYDAGFPRSEGSPCYTVLPNWAAVSLRTGRGGRMSDNDEVAFWRGGQVTEEGLKWLLDKGYKIIVDLRAERVKDQQSLDAIEKAVSSGKIQVVHFPVQIGAAPTKAQVEEFAALVLNYQSSPLYLHSQEGVWRTSAMVSRWRELISRSSSHHGSSSMFKVNGILPKDVLNHKKDDTNSKRLVRSPDLQVLKTEDSVRSLNLGIGSLLEVPDRNHSLRETVQTECPQLSDFTTGKHNSQTVGHVLDVNEGKNSKRERDENQAGLHHQESFWTNNPFEAQRPTCNVLSKREMSEFMKNRKIAPKTYCESGRKRSKISSVSSNSDTSESIQNGEIAGAAGRWGLAQPGILTATSSCKDLVSVSACVKSMEEHVRNVENSVSFDVDRNSTDECIDETNSCSEAKSENCSSGDEGFSGGSGSSSKKEVQNGSFVRLSLASPADDNDDLEPVNGNMCASTTGVVRVQSRKKAEMYLVRTDGFTCARERVKESSLAFTHPSTQQQMLMWKTPPKTVLLLKKLGNELMEEAKQVASFLYHQERMNVVVEPDVHDTFARIPGFGFVQTFYNQDTSDLHERVDFVACLGGDGVILHASNLFREAVPPVVSFSLGSLGFLTAHPFTGFKPDLRAIIHGNTRTDGVYITLRMRLRCEIFRNGKAMPGKVFDVLNEVVVDRGSNPYLCKIECYEHNRLITKVQADGVIVATPTGSTAYSTAAGGSMVHPNVPCMLFTPICPHSLSFRPVILPDSAQLELKIPDDARSNAWVSFDGKRRQQLSKGDSVRVCMSEHPLPTVNKSDQTGDWFRSLVRCLNWNERLEQKALIG